MAKKVFIIGKPKCLFAFDEESIVAGWYVGHTYHEKTYKWIDDQLARGRIVKEYTVKDYDHYKLMRKIYGLCTSYGSRPSGC